MLQNELKEQLKKAKFQNKITLAIASLCLVSAIAFGVLYFINQPKAVIEADENESPSISQVEDMARDGAEEPLTEDFQEQIDSLSIVIDTLSNRLKRVNQQVESSSASASFTVDHISQLIENAKTFSETNCNKSLAFLYAAKKVSQMDGTSEANKQAINKMINKCEASLFGKKPGEEMPTSSLDNNSRAKGGQ